MLIHPPLWGCNFCIVHSERHTVSQQYRQSEVDFDCRDWNSLFIGVDSCSLKLDCHFMQNHKTGNELNFLFVWLCVVLSYLLLLPLFEKF